MEKPLVTFALLAYNQEQFILEALHGALEQRYSPLQIILSDDCSSDRTFYLMKNVAINNSDKKNILLNRNEKNLGIGGHINKIMELAVGELVVVAAGDDISFPCRTETLVSEWISNGKRVDSLHSSVICITREGVEKNTWSTQLCKSESPIDFIKHHVIIGASHAWTKRVFEKYGKLSSNIVREDRVIGFRSSINGGVLYIDKPLLKYRLGGISNTEFRDLNIEHDDIQNRLLMTELLHNYCDILKIKCTDTEVYDAISETMNYLISMKIKGVAKEKGRSLYLLKKSFVFNKIYLGEFIRNCLPLLHYMKTIYKKGNS